MNEQQQARVLSDWLERGGPPPEGLDPEVLATVYALRPDLAPEPSLSADDILADIVEGPLAPSEFDFEDAVDDAFLEAAGEIVDLGSRRRVKPFAWIGGLAAAAALLVGLRAGTLDPEPPRTVDMVVPLDGAPVTAPVAEEAELEEEPALAEDDVIMEADEAVPAEVEEKVEAETKAVDAPGSAPSRTRDAMSEKAASSSDSLGTLGGLVGGTANGSAGAASSGGAPASYGAGSSADFGAASAPAPAAPPAAKQAARPTEDAAPSLLDAEAADDGDRSADREASEQEETEREEQVEVIELADEAVVRSTEIAEITSTRRRASRKAARETAPASQPAIESADVARSAEITSMRAGAAQPTADQALARSSDIAKAGNPGAAARYLSEFIVEPAADGQRVGLRAVRYALDARQPVLARRLADKAIALDPTSERADQIRQVLQGSP